MDDDQTGQICVRINEMAARAAHESGKSGGQTNLATPVATDPDAPTAAEFRLAFGEAFAQLLGLLDDQGEPMNLSASSLTCVVPPAIYVSALEALNASMLASTENVLRGAAKVLTMPRLTDASCWYVLTTDVPVRPFIFQDRDPIEFTALEGKSHKGFLREKYLYGVRVRYALTYGYRQHAIRNDFTGA